MLTLYFRKYMAFKALTFWVLIFVAWLSYPAEHSYSIMSHTFSFLGSWDPEHNPRHWWIFTCAMVFWGLAMLPIIAYLHTRFSEVGVWGARAGTFLMLLGSLGVVLVGLVPDARDTLYGETRWTDIHELAAVMIGVGYALAILVYAILILKDRFTARHFAHAHGLGTNAFVWPYLMWCLAIGVAVHNQVGWALTYAERRAAAQAAGQPIGSSWAESLHTINAFPLWENIVIYALYAFLIWFPLVVHSTEKQGSPTQE